MATLQEYMARRDLSRRSGVYGTSASAGSQGKYWWIREREDEDVLTAARRAGLYGSQLKQETAPVQKSQAGFLEKSWETGVDVVGNILSGAAKSLEGIFDLGLGAIGAVGGIFDKGVRDEMRRLVEYDWTGENVSKHFDRWSDDSIMNNSRAGRIAEGVFSGVGQLLPTVAISVATGGTALPGMVAVGAGAAGNATEEAFNDGADYYRGLGYGVVSGGVEMATEKLFGGLGGLMGGGMLDNVTRSIAKTGAARVAKEIVGEAAEEALAEVVNPLARTIYKGRDALSDYGRADYWGGVGEAALVGGLTSAAYGGTVGRALKTSGKYADVQAVKEEIEAINQKRRNLFVNDKLTDVQEEVLQKSEVANYRALQQILQRSSDKKRADLIKRGNLSEAFDESGTLRTDFLRSLGENVTDGQTDTSNANEAQGAKLAAVDKRYVTPGLFYQQEKIGKDISKINERRLNYADGANAAEVRLFDGELSEQGKQNYKQAKRIFSSLSGKSGGKLQMAILDSAAGTLGVNVGDTVYISASTLEDGRYIKTMIEEVTHFAQGTEEHGRLARFLGENEDLLEEAESELLSEGNPYGFTEENVLHDGARAEEYNNELAAHMAAKLLDDKTYINRLVRQDSSLAEKIMGRLSDMGSAIARLTEKSAQQQYRRVKQASQMFEDAVTSAGWRYVNGAIEKEDEEPNYHIVALEDGKVYVKASRNIIDGEDIPTWRRQISDFFDLLLDGNKSLDIPTIEGDVLTITKAETANKARDNYKQVDGAPIRMNDEEFRVKLNAETHIDELAEISSKDKVPVKKDTKSHSFAGDGFTYRTAYFQDFDGKYYKVRLSIGNDGTTATVYNVGKITEDALPSANIIAVVGSKPLRSASSDISIAQNSEKSSDVGGFSLEKVGGDANQQTSGDIDEVGELSLQDLYDMDVEDVDVPSVRVTVNDWNKAEEDATEKPEGDGVVYRYSDVKEELKEAYHAIEQSLPIGDFSIVKLGRDEKETVLRQWISKFNLANTQLLKERYALEMAKDIVSRVKIRVADQSTAINGIIGKDRLHVLKDQIYRQILSSFDTRGKMVKDSDIARREEAAKASARNSVERRAAEKTATLERTLGKRLEASQADARESRKITAEAQKATTAMRHDKEAAERKLETAKKRNEFLVERNDALREDARESRKMTAEAQKATTAMRHDKEAAERKLETAKKRNEFLVERNDALREDARESRKMTAEAQKKVSETNERTKLGERIGKKVGEIAAARQGKFMASSGYKSDILRTSVESLSQINYGKTVSGSVRGIIKKLAEWYTMGNPLLTEEFGFDQEIALQMDEIALGEEDVELSYAEMKMLDNIMGHMLYMEKHYQKIRKGGRMVDTMEYAKKYVEKLKAAGEDATGLVKVLLRGKYMRQFGDPLALVKAADAYDPNGFFTETYREFRQAAVEMAVREMELMEDWRSFHDKHKGFDKRMIKDTVEFRGQDMRLGEAISLYMTLQRKQAQRGVVQSP